jgi:spore coat protein H
MNDRGVSCLRLRRLADDPRPQTRAGLPTPLVENGRHAASAISGELAEVERHLDEANAFDPSGIEDARERILAAIVRRRGQSAFRGLLLAAYGARCAITGCAVAAVLEAAHIVPYQGQQTNHVRNGLHLRSDWHALFDLRLVTVNPATMRLVVTPIFQGSGYTTLFVRARVIATFRLVLVGHKTNGVGHERPFAYVRHRSLLPKLSNEREKKKIDGKEVEVVRGLPLSFVPPLLLADLDVAVSAVDPPRDGGEQSLDAGLPGGRAGHADAAGLLNVSQVRRVGFRDFGQFSTYVHLDAEFLQVREQLAPLGVNMDKFGEEQTFHGMDKWHLSNSLQDPTYLTELICGEMYRAEGVPASRIAHALVTINGKKKGLYYLKEGYDKHFRKRHFENPHGNLYDSGFLQELDKPLQLLSGSKGDVEKHTDLKALWAAVVVKKPDERFKKLEKVLDVGKFVTYLCLQVLTWDVDGYPMNLNNYRLYHDPKKDKTFFIPSGMDQMFTNPKGPLLPHFNGRLARAFLETAEGKERYLKRMAEILKKLDVAAVVKRIDELQKRLQPALESVDERAAREYPKRVKRLSDVVVARVRFLEEQLAKTKK